MRPGHEAPENTEALEEARPLLMPGFNEAGARSPGKPAITLLGKMTSLSFNEAGARSPGKRADTDVTISGTL